MEGTSNGYAGDEIRITSDTGKYSTKSTCGRSSREGGADGIGLGLGGRGHATERWTRDDGDAGRRISRKQMLTLRSLQMARNSELAPHVGRHSRSAVFAKRGNFKGQKTSTTPKKVEESAPVEKKVGGAKNGGSRTLPGNKAAKFYPVSTGRRKRT